MSDLYVGCVARDGDWLAAAYADDAFDHAAVLGGIGEVWARYEDDAAAIAVDVPIGLATATAPRPNERAAAAFLGDRRDAVDPTPVRDAARKQRYAAAARVHERKTGRTLPEAAFDRARAIAAVDEFLATVEDAREVLVEANPALCYRAFAGAAPSDPPDVAAGYAERMATLAGVERDAPPTVQSVAAATAGNRVPIPAVLDAVALALTVRPGPGERRTLPADPPTDEAGLPMRYVYRRDAPLSAE